MMSKVHFWIVCDAVDYIKRFGDERQRTALQTFQLAYGEKKSIEEIPAAETAVEYLAGFESWQTDKFKDLSLRMRILPGVVKHAARLLAGQRQHRSFRTLTVLMAACGVKSQPRSCASRP